MVGGTVDTVVEMYKLVSIQIGETPSLNILSVRWHLKSQNTALCPHMMDHESFEQRRCELAPETVYQSLLETCYEYTKDPENYTRSSLWRPGAKFWLLLFLYVPLIRKSKSNTAEEWSPSCRRQTLYRTLVNFSWNT